VKKLFGSRRVAWAAAVGTIGVLGSVAVGTVAPAGAATGAGADTGAGVVSAGPGASARAGHLAPRPIDVTVPATSTAGSAVPAANPALATWAGSFSYGGKTYPYRMVGSNPTAAKTTTVPVSITPIKLVLSDGSAFWPTGAVTSTSGSALFHNATFKTGTTEYGDAIQRGEFWTRLNPASHSRLGVPTVKAMITINVPAADGGEVFASDGQPYAAVDIDWLDAKLRARAATVAANTLPIYLTYETYLYEGSGAPGIGGYHSAVNNSTGNHTYAYASWVTGDAYGPSSANLAALSHEVAEWFNDPFVNNIVPNWTVANEPQYGCSNVLEVGDPLVGTVWKVGGLNFQDEAFLSWFARQKPSIGYGGAYSFRGTFHTYSAPC
jgi:hypothetical protein